MCRKGGVAICGRGANGILIGAAGTGKTILAFEQARRQAAKGKRVLFTCFNRLLAGYIEENVKQIGLTGSVHVANYHKLMVSLLMEAGIRADMAEDWETFNRNVDEIALDALDRLGAFDRYDYMIMDEGQDLMSQPFIDTLGMMLKGGIEKGDWTVCFDPGQVIFKRQFEKDLYDQFIKLGRKSKLSINCRNTRQIAAYVKGVTEQGVFPAIGAEGPDPVFEYYRNFNEYLRKLKSCVNFIITEFKEAGLPGSEIVILTSDNSFLPDDIKNSGFFLRSAIDIRDGTRQRDAVQLCTIQSFKGLEAKAVILVGINDLHSSEARDLFYVGASRAKAIPRVLLPEKCAAALQLLLGRILEALSSKQN